MKQILIDIKRCLACKSCEFACALAHSESGNIFAAVLQQPKPTPRVYVESGESVSLPVQCRHCENPQCIRACMSGALYRDEETGVVQNHPEKCVGCWMCVMVCPFGAISQDKKNKSAVKCDRCGQLETPACVLACPTKALRFEEVDKFSKHARKQFLYDLDVSKE